MVTAVSVSIEEVSNMIKEIQTTRLKWQWVLVTAVSVSIEEEVSNMIKEIQNTSTE